MQIGHIRVENYRGLKDVQADISRFACIIGENNAGKSSLLQAFVSFLDGKTLNASDYYDDTLPVTITLRFDNVDSKDLRILADERSSTNTRSTSSRFPNPSATFSGRRKVGVALQTVASERASIPRK